MTHFHPRSLLVNLRSWRILMLDRPTVEQAIALAGFGLEQAPVQAASVPHSPRRNFLDGNASAPIPSVTDEPEQRFEGSAGYSLNQFRPVSTKPVFNSIRLAVSYRASGSMTIRLSKKIRTRSLQELLDLTPDESTLTKSTPPEPDDKGTDPTSPAPPFLSPKESAAWLCVHLSTLKRLVARVDLGTLRVGARRKIPASYLAAYVAREIMTTEQVIDIAQSEPH